MVTTYSLPVSGEPTVNEIEIKRSRFITWIARAESEEEAREVIARARHEFPDARHHCSAFIVHVDGAVPIERSSDDGEPAGTAGKPMLDVLRGSGLESAVAVVIRYFGGVKLGAGGLVHAYSESVSAAVEQVPRAEKSLRELVDVDLPHADAGRIEAELRTHGIDVVDVAYGAQVRYTFALIPGSREEFDALLAAVTQGSAAAREAGTMWVERPR
ncbi:MULTISPECIES: YigZ family protein [unclassified Corynebacterium]|uniref:YigZ family protein n=1 Tax=unclassified Corynebacterium TaxID=2624378 RepID=UPI00264E694C|nr:MULTISPECIES: YigZ family protein [unclassified Corynebacterium]MDN8593645.1 YigZ family protein [Corynebacterium sp. P4_F2]WKK55767.1 YigZ family protein [Corynebacterium sp. P4-C1]WKK63174.1 YigZ family protein [Corynebacterium sp. P8-C1]